MEKGTLFCDEDLLRRDCPTCIPSARRGFQDAFRSLPSSIPFRGCGLFEGGGRWGVAQACNCRVILDAIAMLIEAQRSDLAMVLIEKELNTKT